MKNGLFLVLMMSCLLFACSKSDNNNTTPPATTPATVSIDDFSFKSSSLTIKANTTVTWTNNDDAPHTVTADDNSYTSSSLSKGATYSHTYTTAGTYKYHCNFHSMMMGTIVVQ